MRFFTKYKIVIFGLLCFCSKYNFAQKDSVNIRNGEKTATTTINGKVVKVLILDGDTIPIIDMDGFQLSEKKYFLTKKNKKRFHQWRKYAAKVYPYAADAIKLYRDHMENTSDLKKRKRRKLARKMEKELVPKYEDQLKKLTKSQGFILIKMVERELGTSFYNVIAELEGGWKAFTWQSLGVWYGYNLKKGYDPAEYPLLEAILSDLNINYGID